MAALNIRMPDPLKVEAAMYADGLGLSLNSLLLVALREYLDARAQGVVSGRPTDSLAAVDPKLARVDWSMFPKRGPGANCLCGSRKPFAACHGR